jgi:hypothetical protein
VEEIGTDSFFVKENFVFLISIEIYTGSSQCINLPQVFCYTPGKLQLLKVIAVCLRYGKCVSHVTTGIPWI